MLSEEEEKRIKLIETYQWEARNKLEDEKAKKFGIGKVYYFFNSKLGLWLLSVIFVSGGVKVYDDYKYKKEDEKNRHEIIEKLDNEISYTFNRLLTDLDNLKKKRTEGDTLKTMREQILDMVIGMENKSNQNSTFLYQEYQHWSLLAMTVELNRQLTYLGQPDPEIEQVIQKINSLNAYFDDRKLNYNDVEQIKTIIKQELILSRWQSNSLYSH
jgi:hypothetical protein